MRVKKIKKQFPIFDNNEDLVYLDSAATSQKPKMVIDAIESPIDAMKLNTSIMIDLIQKEVM